MFNLNDTLWKSFGSFVLIACKGTCTSLVLYFVDIIWYVRQLLLQDFVPF